MTKEDLIEKIQEKINRNQSGDITGTVLQEILIDILDIDIEPTVIDLSTLDSGELYTLEQLSEAGLTEEVMRRIYENPSSFNVSFDEETRLVVTYVFFFKDDISTVFNMVAGITGADTGGRVEIQGDADFGFTYTFHEV